MKKAQLENRIEVLEIDGSNYRTAIAAQGAQLQTLLKIHMHTPEPGGFTAGDYAEMIAAGVLLALALYWLFSPTSD